MSDADQEFDPFQGPEIERAVPLTPEQRELWMGVQIHGRPANLAYNEAITIRFEGTLDVDALKWALNQLLIRHEALRSVVSGDGMNLCVMAEHEFPLSVEDFQNLSTEEREHRRREELAASVTEPFDLVEGPLARAVLMRLQPHLSELVFFAHHLVFDGWSGGLIVEDLGELYSMRVAGAAVDQNAASIVRFSDYARLRADNQGSASTARSLAYWLDQYKSVPPPLELPTDFPRTAERSFDGDRIDYPLDWELVTSLKQLGARHGASLVSTMFAAFQTFLFRITGQSSVVVGLLAAGQALENFDRLVGHCVRTLPVRGDLKGGESFSDFVRRTSSSILDASEHAELTMGSLLQELALQRDPSRIPLVSVLFNIDPALRPAQFQGVSSRANSVPRCFETFEWFINGVVVDNQLVLETTYNKNLFDRETMKARLREFETLLRSVVQAPQTDTMRLDLLPKDERAWLLGQKQGGFSEPSAQTIHGLIFERSGAWLDEPAVECNGQTISYRELEVRSGQVAAALVAKGVAPGSRVGIMLSRSIDLIVGMLGILRGGAAYVPLDPEYPQDRLSFIAEDAGLSILVTEEKFKDRMAGLAPVLVSECRDGRAPDITITGADAAYIIFTSGSTGKPKGVIVEHRNAVNFLRSMSHAPGVTRGDRLVAVTTPSFDISVLEIFTPLSVGARVVIATSEQVVDGHLLSQLLDQSQASILQATPATWRALIEAGWKGSPGLKALCGGEALSTELSAELRSRVSELWNCYGPTETTVWSTVEKIEGGPITIGRPIHGTVIYVLDEQTNPVPIGVTGELYIGGAGVTRGYHNRDELTRERFVNDPFVPGDRMYRTGDLARFRADGRIEWLGRADFQVKVRGFRIELGEIESALTAIPGIVEAVVIVREDRPGDHRIVAYLRGDEIAETELRRSLGERLPRYMVPQHFVRLATYPLTPNGKVDRKALPRPGGAAPIAAVAEPLTETERYVLDEMCRLLAVPRMGRDDDFFSLGGHSLLAMRLIAQVRAHFNVDIPVRIVFAKPTAAALAEFVDTAKLLLVAQGQPVAVAGAEDLVL